jgi:hypothetical protein
MKNSLFMAFAGFCLCLFGACGAQPAKEQAAGKLVQMDFYIRYVEPKREIQAEVSFFSDTGAVELKGGNVSFAGHVMTPRRLPKVGVQYRFTLENMACDTVYTFELTEANGQSRQIRVPMNRIVEPSLVSKGGLSKKNGGLLAWKGKNFEPQDALTINLSDAKGSPISINHVGITREPQLLNIAPAFLASLDKGKLTLQLVKKWVKQEEQQGVKVFIRTEFYFSPLEVNLAD